jgi:ankyrin repeat protein
MGIDLENSPLYKSVIHGKVDGVRSSLTGKVFSWDFADDDEDDYIFRSALEKAIELNHQAIVAIMLQSQFGDNECSVGNWRSHYVAEALEISARLGKQEIVRQLLETEKDNIRKISVALTHGVWSRNLQILKMLIDAGASSNCETGGTNPYNCCC